MTTTNSTVILSSSSEETLLADALEEVHTRFILNLPDSELQRADRILFQLEQAWWFYEDFLVDQYNNNNHHNAAQLAASTAEFEPPTTTPLLPSYSLKQFAQQLFEYSPLLDPTKFNVMWNEFTAYKKKIGTYGCILLSPDCQRVVLVQLWNSNTHTFPSGKINQGEEASEAAARETYEETGFDVFCRQGRTAEWKEQHPDKITWNRKLDETNALSYQEESGKRRTCYIVHGVPQDFPFQAIARKEIAGIAWHPIDAIPRPSFAVNPFLSQLKKWIRDNHHHPKATASSSSFNTKAKKSSNKQQQQSTPKRDRSNPKTEQPPPSQPRSSSRRKGTPGRNRSNSRVVLEAEDALVSSGLAAEGDISGWSEEDMFATNEKLLGRKITYDGNPHIFSEGFGGQDPHAFHVVGGTFLNSSNDGIAKLAPAPSVSRLQPLFRTDSHTNDDDDDDLHLTPFFSNDGVTPLWGDGIEPSSETTIISNRGESTVVSNNDNKSTKQTKKSPKPNNKSKPKAKSRVNDLDRDTDAQMILTDAQITAKSQAEKSNHNNTNNKDVEQSSMTYLDQCEAQYQGDMQYIRDWVSRLPKPQPTKYFGDAFRLDANAIMAQLNPLLEGSKRAPAT